MSDDLANLFSLDGFSAASAATTTASINQSVGSLPPLPDIGKGVFQEMRPSGNVEVSFIALGTHAT